VLEPKKRSNRLLANKEEELKNEKEEGNELKSRAGYTKHSCVGIVSTYNNSKYERNIVLHFDSLLEFCISNTVCKLCRCVLERDAFRLESAGVAFDITYDCKGCRKHALAKKNPYSMGFDEPPAPRKIESKIEPRCKAKKPNRQNEHTRSNGEFGVVRNQRTGCTQHAVFGGGWQWCTMLLLSLRRLK
jgi:hypothetical protein